MGDKIRVFEAFAGYGSQSIALKNLDIPYEVVAISEIDKYAIKAYEAIHGQVNNLGDISKIKIEDIPQHDLFTYSFPCQDISVAGKQEGIVKGQTRSGLLYECERIIEAVKPKYLLLENVKNLISKKHKEDFDKWLEYLETLGYTNYWDILNAKDFGVPQSRERVFVVSILGEHKPFKFPDPILLDKCVKDILEESVDEKYYLSEEIQGRFKLTNQSDNIIGTVKPDFRKIGQRDNVYNVNGVIGTLIATDYKQPKQILDRVERLGGVFDTEKSRHQAGSVYNKNGISPTLDTMQGGWRQPCILCERISQDVKVRKHEVNIEKLKDVLKNSKKETGLSINQIADKLNVKKTTVDHWFRSDNCFSIPDEDIWMKLKELLKISTDEFDSSIMEFEYKPNEFDMNNRVYRTEGISPTLTASGGENGAKKIIEHKDYFAEGNYRIRKLTPKECFRLMGMNEEDIEKIQSIGISNTQQYKMAGNSIVVNVLEGIFKELFI